MWPLQHFCNIKLLEATKCQWIIIHSFYQILCGYKNNGIGLYVKRGIFKTYDKRKVQLTEQYVWHDSIYDKQEKQVTSLYICIKTSEENFKLLFVWGERNWQGVLKRNNSFLYTFVLNFKILCACILLYVYKFFIKWQGKTSRFARFLSP